MKSRRMYNVNCVYEIGAGKHQGKNPHGGFMCRQENNVKMHLQERGFENSD
jgi:hypothetical protein